MSKSKKSFQPSFSVQTEIHDEEREAHLTIEVEEGSVQEAMRLAARRLSRQLNIPGFRKGRAPYSVVLRWVGEAPLLDEAVDLLLDALLAPALEKAGVEPYRQPRLLSMETEPKMRFSIAVPLAPTVEIGDIREFRLPYEAPTVTDEEVEEALEKERQAASYEEPVDRPAEDGDVILASHFVLREEGKTVFEPTAGGEPFSLLLDADVLGERWVEALRGITAGESRAFHVTLPEKAELYGDLAGQEVDGEITVQEVRARRLPPLDDAFANTLGYESMEQMRQAVRERLLQEKLQEAEKAYAKAVEEAVIERAEVRYPKALLDEVVEDMLAALKQDVGRIMPWEDFLRLSGKREEEQREELEGEADYIIRRDLVYDEIAQQLNLQFDEAALKAKLATIAAERDPVVVTERDVEQAIADQLLSRAKEALVAIARGTWQEPETEPPASEEASMEEATEADGEEATASQETGVD